MAISTLARSAIFSITYPSADIFLVIKVLKPPELHKMYLLTAADSFLALTQAHMFSILIASYS